MHSPDDRSQEFMLVIANSRLLIEKPVRLQLLLVNLELGEIRGEQIVESAHLNDEKSHLWSNGISRGGTNDTVSDHPHGKGRPFHSSQEFIALTPFKMVLKLLLHDTTVVTH